MNTLLNWQTPSAPEPQYVHRPTYAVNEEPPTELEVLVCIQKKNNGKPGGDDGISAEMCSLTDLEYADDVVIFAKSTTKPQHDVNLVSKLAAAYGYVYALERVDGDVPESYFECLSQFNHVLTKTLKCTYEAVGTGCTSNEKNVLSKRNFTLFEEIFLNDFHEIAEKVDVAHAFKTKAAEDMSRCLLSCFYPAENMCTRLLMCGVFMPNELRLLDNLTKCALKSDVSRGIMMEIATCMTSVVETPRTTTTALTEE
ncbi:hypothetical protein RB195_019279 [Necator americanus]|uniref:Reverse transcriptase domain-containing protein n=1 Tax=Necator americanus TaxID=51031 RepID=A0ABR1CFF6_NECAM